MQKYILTTGPALGNEVPFGEIHSEKNIYRINGAHGSIADIEKVSGTSAVRYLVLSS